MKPAVVCFIIVITLLAVHETNAQLLSLGGFGCSIDIGGLLSGSFGFSCETSEPTCLVLCLYTEVYGSFNIFAFLGGPSFLAAGICLYPELVGFTTPLALCLEVDSKEIIGFSEGGDALEGSGRVCTAKAGEGADGEQCNSCFVCADGGITFDCTNVSEGMISSTCTDIGVPIPTTFWEVIGSADIATTKAKYPELDG